MRINLRNTKLMVPALLLIMLMFSSCATRLSTIKSEPEKYAGADVMISAVVDLEAPIPFMEYSLYRISDDTDRMFLFTDKKYQIGEPIRTKVHVIGINDKNSKTKAEEIAQQTSDFLINNGITDAAKASSFSKKLVRLIMTLGDAAEGSYFLIAR